MHNFHLCWYWIDLFTRSCPDSVCTWIKRTSGGETAATTHILAMGACCMHANMQHTAWNRLVELDNLQNSTHIPQYTRKQTTLNFKDNKESKALILLMLVAWVVNAGQLDLVLVDHECWWIVKAGKLVRFIGCILGQILDIHASDSTRHCILLRKFEFHYGKGIQTCGSLDVQYILLHTGLIYIYYTITNQANVII